MGDTNTRLTSPFPYSDLILRSRAKGLVHRCLLLLASVISRNLVVVRGRVVLLPLVRVGVRIRVGVGVGVRVRVRIR